ncbi:uncharacterized protein WCC33_011531 [Rhinophrynus dorsalis]
MARQLLVPAFGLEDGWELMSTGLVLAMVLPGPDAVLAFMMPSEESSDMDWAPSSSEEEDTKVSPPKKIKSQTDTVTPAEPAIPHILDAKGKPLFDPEGIKHPRSSEWSPRPHIAQYLETWVRKPMSRATRNKLRAECPRPLIPNKVCNTPELDTRLVKFMSKTGRDPRKGLDKALKSCQDKLLDSLGPITKIFELSEDALLSDTPIDVHILRGWVQRAICLIGNANSALASERRRTLLLRLDPKLADMATSEPGPSAQGQLFGDSFIKELGQFVSSFTALDKAQSSLKKIFNPKLFNKAGRSMGRSSGRNRQSSQQMQGPSYPIYPSFRGQTPMELRQQGPFFPPRGRCRPGGFRNKHLLRKGAIRQAPAGPAGFISNIFLVGKKNSGLRPVINLRALNECVLYRHFKMEGIHILRDLLLLSDWMIKIDLKDAYLTVPMAPSSQIFLQFSWHDQTWQFTCLPFGLSSAPRCFTKLLKPVVASLRSHGVRLIIYLDDILIMSQYRSLLCIHTEWTIRLLTDLGFLINWEKSELIPSQRIQFLGFIVDSLQASLSLPGSKIRMIRKEIRSILRLEQFSLRKLARVVGLLSASIQAIFPGPLHYRALQRLKTLHLRRSLGYTDIITLSSDAREELIWWLKHLDAWNGKAIFGMIPDLVIESDASMLGWGARLGNLSTGGKWSPQERRLHINCLELLAGSFALKSLAKDQWQIGIPGI